MPSGRGYEWPMSDAPCTELVTGIAAECTDVIADEEPIASKSETILRKW